MGMILFTTGLQPSLTIHKSNLKHKIKSNLSSLVITKLIFTSEQQKNLSWVNRHEFRYQERLYDLISIKNLSCDEFEYSVVEDELEYEILQKIHSLSFFYFQHTQNTKANNCLFFDWELTTMKEKVYCEPSVMNANVDFVLKNNYLNPFLDLEFKPPQA